MGQNDELELTVDGMTYHGTWSADATGHVMVSLDGGANAVSTPRANTTPEQLAQVVFRKLVRLAREQ